LGTYVYCKNPAEMAGGEKPEAGLPRDLVVMDMHDDVRQPAYYSVTYIS
jgi:hypothetical protein